MSKFESINRFKEFQCVCVCFSFKNIHISMCDNESKKKKITIPLLSAHVHTICPQFMVKVMIAIHFIGNVMVNCRVTIQLVIIILSEPIFHL